MNITKSTSSYPSIRYLTDDLTYDDETSMTVLLTEHSANYSLVKVHNSHIPDDIFTTFLNRFPQVSVELFLETDRGVLLLRRTNEPAAGEWFWPGTRLFKGESFAAAAQRLAQEELGVSINLDTQLGTYSHFWDTSAFDEVESTHTVNVVYRSKIKSPENIVLDDQHNDLRFVEGPDPSLHDYVNEYLYDAGY